MAEQVVIGVDVSKARLDVAVLPTGEQFTVSNDVEGVASLSPGQTLLCGF
jgi:transposase